MVLDSKLRRYGLATVSCGLAFAVAWPFDSFASIYFLAVMVSSLYGGKGPGLFSVALSALAYNYFWLPPQFHRSEPFSYFRFAFFLGTLLAIVGLIETKWSVEEVRRQIAAKVQKSESYLAEAERLGHTGSWASNPHLQNTYFSAEMFRILGFPVGDAPPSTQEIGKLFAPEDWARIKELFETARREKITFDGEFPAILPDGSKRTIRIVGHPVLDAVGDIVEFVGTAIDVTERNLARTALQKAFDAIKKSEDQLRAIINTIPALAWVTGPDGVVEFFNQRWLNYTGFTAEQALEWGWTAVIHPDDLTSLADYWRSVLASGEPSEMEARLRHFDGAYRWFLFRANPLRDESGNIVKWYGTNVDIQERKWAEEALRASEHNLRLIVDTVPALVCTMTAEGEVESVNRQNSDYCGYVPRDLGAIHPDDLGSVVARWRHSVETGKPYNVEHRLRRFDGVYRWFDVRGLPLRDAEGHIVRWYILLTDGEDRKRAEEALQASERDLSLIIETMPGLVWCAAPDGDFNYLNRRILGYSGATLHAWERLGWTNFLHPDDVEPAGRAWSRAVATGQTHEIQCRLRRSDGLYRWFHVLGQAARDSEGGVTRWYGLLLDIDDRKNMEEALRNTEARLSRATQIATVGELSASIAHEINQPLAAVVASGHACLRFLSAQPPSLAKAYEAAESIVRDGKEAAEVVRRIRALFRRAAVEKVMLNLNDVIGEVLRLLGGETAKRHVAVETELGKDLPLVPGDRVQLQQLVLNLLLNGMEAMDPVHDRPKKLRVCSEQDSPETVLVEVRDYGVGVENPDRVFEAFVTTKDNGMGMGLTICRSIVEAHNGRLWAAAGEGPGATFCFALPLRLSAESMATSKMTDC